MKLKLHMRIIEPLDFSRIVVSGFFFTDNPSLLHKSQSQISYNVCCWCTQSLGDCTIYINASAHVFECVSVCVTPPHQCVCSLLRERKRRLIVEVIYHQIGMAIKFQPQSSPHTSKHIHDHQQHQHQLIPIKMPHNLRSLAIEFVYRIPRILCTVNAPTIEESSTIERCIHKV